MKMPFPVLSSCPNWKKLVLTFLFFICVKIFVSGIVLSSFSRILLDIEIDHPDQIDVYYGAVDHFTGEEVYSVDVETIGTRHILKIPMHNEMARRVRLDLGLKPGKIKLYSMEFRSYFGESIRMDAEEIHKLFKPVSDIADFELINGVVKIRTSGADPYMVYTGEDLAVENSLISMVFPALLSLAFYIVISTISFPSLAAIDNIHTKNSSVGSNIPALDGLRGFAALLVLAEHTGVYPNGIGTMGVWIFFSLSGFLLAVPFAREPGRALSWEYMCSFGARRLKRILPMYYVFLGTTYLFSGRVLDFFRHALFIQGDGHLWTLPQEMLFYVFLPFIVVAIYWVIGVGRWAGVVLLVILIWGAKEHLGVHVLSLYGYGTTVSFKATVFLGGMLFSYIYYWWIEQNAFLQRAESKRFISMAGFVLLIVLFVFAAQMIPGWEKYNPFKRQFAFGILAGVMILLVMMTDGTPLCRFLSLMPLRALGVVSFSFYLLHPKFILFSRECFIVMSGLRLSGWPIFVVAGVLTYLVSVFTYSKIEQPFMGSGRRK